MRSLLAGASVAWASDQGRAFEEAVRASAYLGLFTLAACTASRGGRRQWIAGLPSGLGAVSVLPLLSYLQPGLLDGGELDALIPGAAGRLSYPIGYWNGAGGAAGPGRDPARPRGRACARALAAVARDRGDARSRCSASG